MQIKNQYVIELTVQDAEWIIKNNLSERYGEGEYELDFKVVNKPYPCGAYFDSCDNHVFDGVKVVITKNLE